MLTSVSCVCLVIALRPQTPKPIRGGWSHIRLLTRANQLMDDGNGAHNMVTVPSGFRTRNFSITGPTRLPTSLTRPTCVSVFKYTGLSYVLANVLFRIVGQVRAVGKPVGQWSKGRWFGPRLDSDHILSPITINWFAGISIMWPAAPNMFRWLWA
jgi:hypothetical protein